MPRPSPGNSSTSSPTARKGSRESAKHTAAEAFASQPQQIVEDADRSLSPDQAGRRRLTGAFLIDIDRIEADPQQPRKNIDPTYLNELSSSVKRLGILQPITVRFVDESQKYRIIAGECRYTAAKAAGLREIPCWVKTPKGEQILLEQIVENWQRSNLQPFELADSLAQLRDSNGLTQRQLSREVGKSEGEVSKLLALLDLAPDVQQLARDNSGGRITKRHLYPLLQLDAKQQLRIAHRILEQDLTVGDMERLIARFVAVKQPVTRRGAPVTRRKYASKYGSVLLTFRKQDVTDDDCLAVLKDAITQIKEQVGEPSGFM